MTALHSGTTYEDDIIQDTASKHRRSKKPGSCHQWRCFSLEVGGGAFWARLRTVTRTQVHTERALSSSQTLFTELLEGLRRLLLLVLERPSWLSAFFGVLVLKRSTVTLPGPRAVNTRLSNPAARH
jgi:hypothetical protein